MNSPLTMIFDQRLLAALLLGFASGLPLALSGATLQAWLTTQGASLQSIAWFSLAGLPYTWKFLWSPGLDRFALPFGGRRRGWMVLIQIALAFVLMNMASTTVPEDLQGLAVLAVILAFLSASQDIVIDAWRTEVLSPAQRGMGAAMAVMGYRIGMLVSGALALILAQTWSWQAVFTLMAAIFMVLPLVSLWAPEPELSISPPKTLQEAVIGPLKEFMGRRGAWLLLLLVVAYKLSDAFATALSTTFLLRGVGFSLAEVGVVNKAVALIATLLGAVIGGVGLARLGLVRALLLFGGLQALAALGFFALSMIGHDLGLMVFAVTIENLTSGMGTAAFAALLMGLCSPKYSATQFALLSALSAVGRVYVGPISGLLAESLGWPAFFLFSIAAGLPGLVLVWYLREGLQFEPEPEKEMT
jgi:MFS transporter, PAT family, beta-lactamase induction signal transducer AmpG